MKNNKRYLSREYYIRPVLRLLYLLAELIVGYYMLYSYFADGSIFKTLLALITLIIVASSHIYFLKFKDTKQAALCLTSLAIINTNVSFYLIGYQNLEFVWLVTVPVLAFLLNDKRISILLTTLHVIILSVIYYTQSKTWAIEHSNFISWFNFASLLVEMSLFLYVYEHIREKMLYIIQNSFRREKENKIELARKNRELEKLNLKLYEYQDTLEERVIAGIEQQQLTQALLAQQSKMAAMGEMLASVGHQWKQPLNVISADTSNLELSSIMQTLKEEDVQKHTLVVQEQVEFMSQTLLDFSNFFKQDKQKHYFFIEDAIENILDLFSQLYSINSIKVKLEVKDSIKVFNYKNEFRQVILNILNNAKDVIVEKSPEKRDIDIVIFKDDEYIQCDISDYAGGVDSEILPTIFNAFVSSKEEDKGTGIGLYMSKMIIESSMSGSLEVENRGEGACFSIRLPLALCEAR